MRTVLLPATLAIIAAPGPVAAPPHLRGHARLPVDKRPGE